MRILILSQYYAPEPIPKPSDLARELTRRGHEVVVLTGLPHYPTGVLHAGYRRRLVQTETIDGIRVIRTYEYTYHGTRTLLRVLNYATFMLSAPIGARRLGRFDVMYVWHPPLSVGVAAWLVGKVTRAPFVYDVQDLWPDAAILSGMMKPGPLVTLFSRLERFVYRRAAHLLVVTDGARKNVIGKGVPEDRVTTMTQWVEEEAFGDVDAAATARARARCEAVDRFLVLFTGNLGLVQGLDVVVRAAAALRGRGIRIAFVGDGADGERLRALARELAVGDVLTFVDRQPAEAMPAFMAAADALLVHLRGSDLSKYVIPSKTLSYLAAGRPIVMAMEGAAAELVREAGAGVSVPSGDPEALASALLQVQQMPEEERRAMGARGRRYAETHLTRAHLTDRYERILASVAEAGGSETGHVRRSA